MDTAVIDRPPPTGEGLTFEKVWALFQESDRKMRESDQKMLEIDRRIKENAEKDAREHAEQIKEIKQILRETDLQMKKNTRKMGELSNRFGELAEHLVVPSIAKRFNEMGFHFDNVAPGGEKFFGKDEKIIAQVDIILRNSDYIIAIEVKVKPDMKDVPAHIKRLETLRNYWASRGDRRKVRGAIAGAIFPEMVKQATAEAGLYVLVQSGDTMKIEIPEGFVAREF